MTRSGKVLILNQPGCDCSALKAVLARERYDVIEASLDMGKVPLDIEECCLILMDTLARAPSVLGLPSSHPGDAPTPAEGRLTGTSRRFVWRKPRGVRDRGRAPRKAVKLGDKTVVLNARLVQGESGDVRLTWLECGVLTHLLARINHTVPSVDLVQKLWPLDPTKGVHSLRAFIKNLRKKIEPDPARPQYILTDRTIGYQLRLPVLGRSR